MTAVRRGRRPRPLAAAAVLSTSALLVLPLATQASAATAAANRYSVSPGHAKPAFSSATKAALAKAAAETAKPAVLGGGAGAAGDGGGFNRSEFPAKGNVAVMIQLAAKPAVLAFSAARSGGAAVSSATTASRSAQATVESQARSVESHFSVAATSARTLFTVKNAYSGIAVITDVTKLAALDKLPNVVGIHPLPTYHVDNSASVPLVGATNVWSGEENTGSGVKVGIIDTGIDYTHADFGGTGSSRAYDADHAVADAPTLNVPSGDFPSDKVVGGVDLVGDSYDATPTDAGYQPVPHQDPNPLDCNSHGTHVAGTVAGYGVLKDGSTYDGSYSSIDESDFRIGPGVAPGAQLYAIKVFGCQGSTNVVSEALDWAADPNGDGNFSDHLDVVNMSLGSDYDVPDSPDAVASNNVSLIGVTVAAAAGNGGDLEAISGSPASASRAIAVAASNQPSVTYDGMQVNAPAEDVPADNNGLVPGQRSVAFDWADSGPVSGAVVAVDPTFDPNNPDYATNDADGCDPLSSDQAAAVKGKIAWLEWTDDSASRRCGSAGRSANAVAAGAIGVVLTDDEDSFAAGITGSKVVPVFQIRKSSAATLRPAARAGTLNVTLSNDYANTITLVDGSLTDQIASFSSRGWGNDDTIKPDITAPGVSIFSAGMGTGSQGLTDSGTSMATPHVAGMAALVKAAHPSWFPEQIKAALMDTATGQVTNDTAACDQYASDGSGASYDGGLCDEAVDRVGAGRAQVDKAVATDVLAYVSSSDGAVGVSFGHPQVTAPTTLSKVVRVENDSSNDETYSVDFAASNDGTQPDGVSLSTPDSLTVPAHSTRSLTLTLSIDPSQLDRPRDRTRDAVDPYGLPNAYVPELSGDLELTSGDSQLHLPVYAAPKATTDVHEAQGDLTSFQYYGDDGSNPTRDYAGLSPEGDGINTDEGNYGPGQAPGYESLVAGFELGATSPVKPACSGAVTDYTTCTPSPSDAAGDLLSVGATSDWPDTVNYGATPNQSFSYFAVHTAGPWRTPSGISAGYSEYDFLIDLNNDGKPDVVLYNTRIPSTDTFMSELDDYNTGATLDEELLNGAGGDVDTNALDNDTMVLPVENDALTNAAGPGWDGSLTYTVQSYTGDYGQADSTSPASFNIEKPGLFIENCDGDGNDCIGNGAFSESFASYPLWWYDGAGNDLEVARDKAQLAADGSHQLMLVHLNNALGKDVDILDAGDTSTTALTVTSPVTYGTPAVAKVTVTPDNQNVESGNPPAATGTVSIAIDGTTVGSPVTLSGGKATITLPATVAPGNHSVVASYSGDSLNAASQSDPAPLKVNQAATTTSLSVTHASSAYGAANTATVTVTSPASSVTPVGGTVGIYDGSTKLATVTVTNGTATYSLASLAVGSHSLTARYSGATDYATSSTSKAVAVTVVKDTSKTVLTSSAKTATAGGKVTITATTTLLTGKSAITGTVSFYDGSKLICTYSTNGKTARTVTQLTKGTHTFKAVYSGDGHVLGSTGTVTVTVS